MDVKKDEAEISTDVDVEEVESSKEQTTDVTKRTLTSHSVYSVEALLAKEPEAKRRRQDGGTMVQAPASKFCSYK